MILETVIAQLKARVPLLGQRVAGAASFSVLPESANLPVPAAYVIPLADQPQEQQSRNGYQQACRDEIAVVAVLSNRGDERGQTAAASLQALRAQIFAALLGFQPGADYDAMQFEGGQLLHLDRSRMYYQLEFSAVWEIATEDTWIAARDTELPPFEGINLRVDLVDPSDPNRASPGPDGTVDAGADLHLTREP